MFDIIIYLLLLPPAVHVSYIYVMGIKRAKDKNRLTFPVKVFAYPTMLLMMPSYIAMNVLVGSIIFLEPPRTLYFTKRCQRHMYHDTWRGHIARWFCHHFLDPYDPAGRHC